IAQRNFRQARIIVNFDGGERFQMHMREALLQAANQVEIIIKREIGMQSADDVEFGGAFGDALRGALKDFLEGKCVSARGIGRAAKRAEFAMRDADVCGIDVAVDVEKADVAMTLLADMIGEPAQGQEIVRFEEREAVFGGEALASEHFGRNGLEAKVGDLE